MKKFYLLTKTLLVAVMLMVGASNAWANYGESTDGPNVTLTWDFAEYTTKIDASQQSSETYEELLCYFNTGNTSDYVTTDGFRCNGVATSTTRYIKYTPKYDGTIKVYYKSNNGDANDRIVALSTAVTTGNSIKVGTGGVVAFGTTQGFTVKSFSGSVAAGTSYYIYNAYSGCTITKIEYTYEYYVTETYDFAAIAKAEGSLNATLGSTAIDQAGGTKVYLASYGAYTLGNRFATSKTRSSSGKYQDWWIRSGDSYNCLLTYTGNSNTYYLSVLDLKADDRIVFTIKNGTLTLLSSNVTGIVANSALVSDKSYTMSADGHLDMSGVGQSTRISKVVINRKISDYVTRMATAKSAGTTLYNSESPMQTSIRTALNTALTSSYVNYEVTSITSDNVGAYISALETLETAVSNAQNSTDNFAILNDLIARANTFAATVTSYEAPEGAEDVYASDADVDPVALAEAVRAEVIEEGVKNDDTDITAVIANSSFELGNTLGWTTVASNDTGAKGNSAPYTTSGIDGSWQFNTWSQGTPITQAIGTLPAGKYKLAALVASDGGTIYLKMNNTHNSGLLTSDGGTYVDNEYTFTIASDTEITIGAVGGDDDGSYTDEGHWWYKADKFTLTYVGQDELALAKASLAEEIETATALYESWTPKVGTAPFKYDATYYNALNTAIETAQAVIDADGDVVSAYTSAEDALETAEDNMASSTQNTPDPDKYYQVFVANNDGTASDYNLYMLYEKTKTQVKVSATPYPIKIVVDKDNSSYYNIQTPYGNDLCTDKDAKTIAYVRNAEGVTTRCNQIKFTLNNDGTLIIGGNAGSGNFNNYQASASEGSLVTAPQGGSGKWVISDAVEVTDVNLAVNATTKWGTFIAPYDNLIPSTVKAYTVSHKEDNTIFFTENETGILSANTPYVLSTEEASDVSVAFKGIADNDDDTYNVNGLVGLLTASTVSAGSYILQYQAEKDGTAFYLLDSDMTGTANRCYLNLSDVPNESSARATVRFNIYGGDITGISEAAATAEAAQKDGKFIENGKFVIVKNGKKFNANGVQVK